MTAAATPFGTGWLIFVDTVRLFCIAVWAGSAVRALLVLTLRTVPETGRKVGWLGVAIVSVGILETEFGRFGHAVGAGGRLWWFTVGGCFYLFSSRQALTRG